MTSPLPQLAKNGLATRISLRDSVINYVQEANMITSDLQQLSISLAKELVSIHAPDEIPYFDALANCNKKTSMKDSDDPFAFGIADILPAISPVALQLASTALIFLTEKLANAGVDLLKEKTTQALDNWLFDGPKNKKLSLSEAQKEALTRILLDEAIKQRVPLELAISLSDDFINKVLKIK